MSLRESFQKQLQKKAQTIRKELDKITTNIGSTETMIINELFDKLLEDAQDVFDGVLREHNKQLQEFLLKLCEDLGDSEIPRQCLINRIKAFMSKAKE